MFNIMRNKSKWAMLLSGVLSACLAAGSCGAMAADVTLNLWAKAGTTTLPGGASVNVWGYTGTAGAAVNQPGGPTLVVNQGDVVTINLTNTLPAATAVLFQGQAMLPDSVGAVPMTGTRTYSFTASNPGTYLYEAGLLPNSQYQAAMGLYGALIVRPSGAPLQAYANAATTFNDEAVLVLSELDLALNASPATFDMRKYAPSYFLINGKAYPNTDAINSTAGNKVLLRYVNAGIKHHSMGVLGLRQNFVAKDGSLLPTLNHNVAAETLAPGQTGDAIVTVPALATTASKFAVYDASLDLRNSNLAGFGGMLTFVTAGTGAAVSGPSASALTLTPSPTNGSVAVAVGASLSSSASTITAAEYFIDASGVNGAGIAMAGTFGTATVAVNASLSTDQLAALPAGHHTIYVHGQDDLGNWGAFGAAILNLDKAGPTTSAMVLTPNPSSGAFNVSLTATANDSATGNSNISAARYSLDGGATVAMAVNMTNAPVASVSASIPAGLSAGAHLITVQSQDALGNWGLVTAPITLNVVAGGPVSSGVSASKNPNNGALPLNANQPVVRVTATMTGAGASVVGAEAFIDAVGANGTGIPFVPSDGLWNGTPETGYADIPLATVNALSSGNHTIYVRGRDALGNWGSPNATTGAWPSAATVVLVIDKTAPTLTSITLIANTIAFGTNTSMTMVAADVGTSVVGGQYWFDGTTTPPTNATAFTGTNPSINTSTLAGGTHSVRVRVQDAATNWSTVRSAPLTVVRAVNDARSITANTNATQTSDTTTAQFVLANDQPTSDAGRTASLVSAPTRTPDSVAGAGTVTLSCPAALGAAATPAVGRQTLCTNGAYRATLNGVGTNNTQTRASKRGTFTFTYRETLNAVTSDATVTITVN